MQLFKQAIQWQTNLGDKITIGDITVTPQSQALIIRWPYGGWVWNRLAAVVVEQGDRVERFPVVDITRLVQLTLLGMSLFFSIGILILSIRQRRH